MTDYTSPFNSFDRIVRASTAALVFLLLTAGDALEATSRPDDARTQTVTQSRTARQPWVGEVRWSVDGVNLMRWNGHGWVATGWARSFPFRGERRIYDLFANRAAVARIDERQPEWTTAIDHAGPYKGVPRGWPNHDPQAVHYLMNNQWLTAEQYLTYLVALLQRLTLIEQQRTPAQPRAPGALKPNEIAPNVRREIPMNPALMTKEEVEWVAKSNLAAIATMGRTAQRSACEFNQSSYPYNTVTGAIMPGWYDTVTGPQKKSC